MTELVNLLLRDDLEDLDEIIIDRDDEKANRMFHQACQLLPLDRSKALTLFRHAVRYGHNYSMQWLGLHGPSIAERKFYFRLAVQIGNLLAREDYFNFLLDHDLPEATRCLDRAFLLDDPLKEFLFEMADEYYITDRVVDKLFPYLLKYHRWSLFHQQLVQYAPSDKLIHYTLSVSNQEIDKSYAYMKQQYVELLRFHLCTSPTYFQTHQINLDIWGIIISYFNG